MVHLEGHRRAQTIFYPFRYVCDISLESGVRIDFAYHIRSQICTAGHVARCIRKRSHDIVYALAITGGDFRRDPERNALRFASSCDLASVFLTLEL